MCAYMMVAAVPRAHRRSTLTAGCSEQKEKKRETDTETNRDKQRQIETDRETYKDKQRQTETGMQRQRQIMQL